MKKLLFLLFCLLSFNVFASGGGGGGGTSGSSVGGNEELTYDEVEEVRKGIRERVNSGITTAVSEDENEWWLEEDDNEEASQEITEE